MQMALVVSKYSIKGNGEQSVMITGISMMLGLCVVNLVMNMALKHSKELMLFRVLGGYG